MSRSSTNTSEETARPASGERRVPLLRSVIAGVLMGLANLVPGVSGGTMILVMGVYEQFIRSVAEVSRLRFRLRSVMFLALVAGAAAVAIVTLAGTLSRAVTLYPAAMFSLFIGLTLGGAPLLVKMIRPFSSPAWFGVAFGIAIMVLIAATRAEPPDKEVIREAARRGELIVSVAYGRDFAAGVLGIAAMVLPGISGAYMLLVLDRYEAILAAVAIGKGYVLSGGEAGSPQAFLGVLVPTAGGALVGLVALSNLLKWMLARFEKPTLGLLLGILLGSVIGIWPFGGQSGSGEYLLGGGLVVAGCAFTALLSRFAR